MVLVRNTLRRVVDTAVVATDELVVDTTGALRLGTGTTVATSTLLQPPNATTAETITGTSVTQAVTPAGLNGLLATGPLIGPPALRLTGTSGERVSTPHAAGQVIIGDICVMARVNMWWPTIPAAMTAISKYNGASNQRSWGLEITLTGALMWTWTTGGVTAISKTSTLTMSRPGAFSGWQYIGVTHDVDNGASGNDVRFWTSPDAVTWTQLGDTVTTAGITSIYNSNAEISIGGYNLGTAKAFQGVVSKASVRSGIGALGVMGGTEVAEYNTALALPTYRDAYLNLWTLAGATLPTFISANNPKVFTVYPGITAIQINAIFTANPGPCTVEMNPGEYYFSENVILKSYQSLVGRGRVYVTVADDQSGVTAIGSIGTAVPFTVNQVAGSYFLTLPTGQGANFQADSVVMLQSTVGVSVEAEHSTTARAREMHQVTYVSNDTLALDRPLEFNYNSADTATFALVTPIIEPTVTGITFHYNTILPSHALIYFGQVVRGVADYKVHQGAETAFVDVLGTRVNAIIFTARPYDAADGAWGYGVVAGGSGYGLDVNVIGRNCRHAFTTLNPTSGGFDYTGPFGVTVRGIGWGANTTGSSATFDTHTHCYDVHFVGCLASSSGQTSPGAFHDRGHRTRFIGCKGRSFGRVLRIGGDSRDAVAIGCDFEALDPVAGTVCYVEGTGFRLLGGKIKGYNGVSITPDVYGGVNPSGLVVKGVDIETTGSVIYDNGVGDTLAVVEDNLIHLMGGVGFTNFAGTARRNSWAPGSTVARSGIKGTLAAGAIWEDTDEVFIPASVFQAVLGTPVLFTNISTHIPGWQMDDAASEGISTLIDINATLPGWKTCSVQVQWSNATTDTGTVVTRLDSRSFMPGDATVSITQGGQGTLTATADQWRSYANTVSSPSLVLTGNRLVLRLLRLGATAGDTKVGDASFEGLVLIRLT